MLTKDNAYRFFVPVSRREKQAVNTAGWVAFILSLLTYWLTVAPSASFWDCPEYILTAVRLEVGHPPGNPFWTLFHRIVTIISGAENAALAINLCSGLFTALSVLLMTRISSFLVLRVLKVSPFIGGVAGLCAGLLFAWGDSVWYSAVEAEVYAMSLFFTVLNLWLMFRWALIPDSPETDRRRTRLLLLVVYITGLSVGVHQLNLLSIPCLMLIWEWRLHPERISPWRVIKVISVSFVLIVLILKVMMPGSVYLAGLVELFSVNTLHLPYYSGVIIYFVLIAVFLLVAIFFSRRHRGLHFSSWALFFLLTGYSSLLLIPIRAGAAPYINSGAPSDPFSLYSYIEREQYGGAPLLYGRTPYSKAMAIEELSPDSTPGYTRLALKREHPVWRPAVSGARTSYRSGFVTSADSMANAVALSSGRDSYILSDYRYSQILTPELDMWFPRITSGVQSDIDAYASWIGMDTSNMKRVAVSDAFDSEGNPVNRMNSDGKRPPRYSYRPTYLQNITYFLGYQVFYMYGRYLLWNFSGRQNDMTSSGEADHGNFLTGITPLDEIMIGPSELYPSEAGKDNPGRNRYFMLPLLLCILGIIVCVRAGRAGRRTSFGIFMLFLLTGVAIVVYINQTIGEPRERDYSFLGSFMAFAAWGGFGVARIMQWGGRLANKLVGGGRSRKVAVGIAGAVCMSVPVMMFCENYDDHDRSRRDAATDFACNILKSLEPDAILFTDGDNYTFPLWYVQEVLGVRRDVTVVSLSYLSLPSYLVSLMTPGEDKLPVSMMASPGDIIYGRYAFSRLPYATEDTDTLTATQFLKLAYSADGDKAILPASKVIVKGGDESMVLDLRDLCNGGSRLPQKSLALLDIVATNEQSSAPRPIYWIFHLPDRSYAGMKNLTSPVLYGRRLSGRYDSLPDKAMSEECLSRMKWGGFSLHNPPYADGTVRMQVSGQRAALIRAGQRALEEGDASLALRLARMAADSLSVSVSPLGYSPVEGKVFREGEELPALFIEAGRAAGDSTAVDRGKRMQSEWDAYLKQWKAWRDALPPHLRNAISYRTLRLLQ